MEPKAILKKRPFIHARFSSRQIYIRQLLSIVLFVGLTSIWNPRLLWMSVLAVAVAFFFSFLLDQRKVPMRQSRLMLFQQAILPILWFSNQTSVWFCVLSSFLLILLQLLLTEKSGRSSFHVPFLVAAFLIGFFPKSLQGSMLFAELPLRGIMPGASAFFFSAGLLVYLLSALPVLSHRVFQPQAPFVYLGSLALFSLLSGHDPMMWLLSGPSLLVACFYFLEPTVTPGSRQATLYFVFLTAAIVFSIRLTTGLLYSDLYGVLTAAPLARGLDFWLRSGFKTQIKPRANQTPLL